MPNIDQFLTDNFHILSYLCSLKDKDGKVSITQQEIAYYFGLSRATVNKIVGELRASGYLGQDGNHVGRYILTDKAISVIETFRSIEKK